MYFELATYPGRFADVKSRTSILPNHNVSRCSKLGFTLHRSRLTDSICQVCRSRHIAVQQNANLPYQGMKARRNNPVLLPRNTEVGSEPTKRFPDLVGGRRCGAVMQAGQT